MTQFEAIVRLAIGFFFIVLALVWATRVSEHATDAAEDSLRLYAVHVSENLYGVYLGRGLIITAEHVIGSANPPVRIAGLNLSSKIIKSSPFEQLDLALLSVDEERLPVSLRMRRMPLCERPPSVGEPVVVAIPESTARSQIVSPLVIPSNLRQRFPTAIKDVATTGNSGSGVFDAERKCLLGIMSRKFFVPASSGNKAKDIAKYFVPASVIRAFLPKEYRF